MNTPPIPDEVLADHAIDLFLKRYEPLLYAADLGLTPEQVWDQIRYTLQECLDKLSRQGKAGRPQEDNVKPASIAQRERRRQKRSAMERVEIEIFEESDGSVKKFTNSATVKHSRSEDPCQKKDPSSTDSESLTAIGWTISIVTVKYRKHLPNAPPYPSPRNIVAVALHP